MSLRRTSIIGMLSIIDVSLSSAVRIGDQEQFEPRFRGIEVLDETNNGWAEELYFPAHPLFQLPRPEWPESLAEAADEAGTVTLFKTDVNHAIRVGTVSITAMAGSSLLLVGSCGEVDAEARLKKIKIVGGQASLL
ncbi:spore germination protein GerPE [Paenibacillus tarimensis]|uniref:spore germination protein GerPE n=1 Tax=Paenibacillus tarimensis TaxID=416012 RepID=UPI001F1A1EF9|nr:spore germination protein GerPE [Paenibacillus tarimensis]MCF2942396.1 spore germination protein GerPE [Paenibacillus tarimensis]